MYPSSSLFIAIGQLAIVILVLFSYPLQVHPCRNCLDKVFYLDPVQEKRMVVAEDESIADDEHAESEMSTMKHSLLTTAIITLGFATAFVVDDLRLGKQMEVNSASANGGGSACLCGFDRLHDDFIYFAWFIVLEGKSGGSCVRTYLTGTQLSRGDASVRGLNLAALALAVYGICVCIFW